MMRAILFRIFPLLLIALFTSGCKLYKDPPSTEEIRESAISTNALIPNNWLMDSGNNQTVVQDWYQEFGDTLLNTYIYEALDSANPSIVYRLTRVRGSIAGIQLARAGRAVYMDYAAGYSGLYGTDVAHSDNVGVGIPITWEADLWGRIAAGIEAAKEDVLVEVHQLQYTKISIAADVSTQYFSIGAQKALLDIGYQFIGLNDEIIDLLKKREAVGQIDAKAVHLAQAKWNEINSVVKQNENILQEYGRQLEVILGRYPSNTIEVSWPSDELLGEVQLSDPYTLLSRRPDIRALESQVRQVFYLKQQAELAKYPSLALSVTPGLSTANGFFVSPTASLIGPIFNGKSIRAQVEQLNATQQQLVANYGSAVLQAYSEVETTLHAIQLLSEQLVFAESAAHEYEQAYQVVLDQYKVGRIDLYDVLLIQSQYLGAKISVVNLRLLTQLLRVQLYLSLGGTLTN